MLWGAVPSFKKLDQLVRGLELRGELVRELFDAAEYAPPPDLVGEGETYRQAYDRLFTEMILRLTQEGIPITGDSLRHARPDLELTATDAGPEIAETERLIREHSMSAQ
jgi:hypothetical protein